MILGFTIGSLYCIHKINSSSREFLDLSIIILVAEQLGELLGMGSRRVIA